MVVPTHSARTMPGGTVSRRIDVGGRSLAIECSGSGFPTVVLESGLGAESAWWGPVQDAVAHFTHVCRFDRAGKGLSDLAPTPRTSHDMVADLHTLLANAEIPGPYVLVGQSVGGLNVRLYAARYPDEVAGIVLVDSMHEDQFVTLGPMLPPPVPGEPAALTGVRQFWTADWADPTKNVEGIDFPVSCEQGRAVTSLGDLPMVVLTADYEHAPDLQEAPAAFRQMWMRQWWAMQSGLAGLSTASSHRLVPGSGHFIQRDAPDAVIAAIRQVVEVTRYGNTINVRDHTERGGRDQRSLEAVSAHYTSGDLGARIVAVLHAAGKDLDALQPDDLTPVDQFHTGGQAATLQLIARAGFRPGTHVLDVGGGLGGPARLLATKAGCTVTVLDLSEEFCQVGTMLTARVGLTDWVTFQHGNALAMPFADGSFDAIWTQNAMMNIADKERLYAEMHRVLRPGGRLAMQEPVAGPVQPIHFPVPWARDASISFLRSAETTRALLADAGFRAVTWIDEGPKLLAAQNQASATPLDAPPALGIQLLMGPQFAEMVQTFGRNLRENRLTVIQGVFERSH